MMLSIKREFLVLFLEELHRADAGVFKAEDLAYFKGCACEIHPNKDEHWEWKNIDILIRTADKKRAVVIRGQDACQLIDQTHREKLVKNLSGQIKEKLTSGWK